MSTPVINETIAVADPTRVSGLVRLVAREGGGGVAYTNAATPVTLGGTIRVSFDANGELKADDGETDLELNPNSGDDDDAIASPSGTVWQYEIRYPGDRTPVVRWLDVPDTAGPVQVADITVDLPTELALRARLGDLADVTTAGASDGDSLVYDSATGLWHPVAVEGGEGGGDAAPYTPTAREVTLYDALSSDAIIPVTPTRFEINDGTNTRFPSGGTWGIPAEDPFIPDNTVFDMRDVELIPVADDGSGFVYSSKLTPSVTENRQGVWYIGGFWGNDPTLYDVENEPWATWHDSCAVSVQTADFVHVGGWLYNVGDGWAFSAAAGETDPERTATNWSVIGCAIDGPKGGANDRQGYCHDDAVENDTYYSGLIEDSLFNGVFGFYSAVAGSARDGRAETVTFRDNLVRLAPYDNSFKAYAGTPIYGPDQHSVFFKTQTHTAGSTGYPPNMRFEGRHVFYADQEDGYATLHGLDLPPEMSGQTIEVDSDAEIILIWGGSGDYPQMDNWTAACTASGATLTVYDNLTQEQARAVWNEYAEDWRGKHPILKVGREVATIADESITQYKLADDSLRERHFGNNCIVEDAIYPNTISKDSLALTLFNNYVHGRGTNASRPAAAASNAGWFYYSTDVNGGTLYRSNGTTWQQIGPDYNNSVLVAASDPLGDRAYSAALVDDLSGVSSASTARTNLGLGGAAVLSVGTAAGTVAAGDDGRFVPAAGTGTSGDLLTHDGSANGVWETPVELSDVVITIETDAPSGDVLVSDGDEWVASTPADLTDLPSAAAAADADLALVNQGGSLVEMTLANLAQYVEAELAAADISGFDTQVRTNRIDQMAAPNTGLSWSQALTITASSGTSITAVTPSSGTGLLVGDGTASHGGIAASTNLFGSVVSFYGNMSDGVPKTTLSTTALSFGPGGAGAYDVTFTRSGSAAMAVVGQITFSTGITLSAVNVVTDTSTGTKIGTGTSQKLGFWNATPVVQYSTTGTATGFTAGGGTTATHLSTYTGNTGSTAYTNGDVVRALKLAGIIAA